ncbi:hypothetical protein B296_00034683 [Ensete ventricosum]|uniref:beta-N-acetylhexosaminidase n=1 Tax=Ensete ventricosum TaxID=4639 RepID=A0A426ZCN6_ENSVE|nr:hypothetical protein B296_00034683 [Ensete ventricosum]
MPLAVRAVFLCVGFLAWLFVLAFGGEHDGVNIWPMPKSATHGSQTLFLSKDLVLSTQGSKYGDGSGLLKEAFDRMIDAIEVNHIVDGRTPTSSVLAGLNVLILSPQDQLNYGIDESYKLDVPAAGKHVYARIEVVMFVLGDCYTGLALIIYQPSISLRLGGGVAQKVVAAGLRCIVSNQDKWYLDHLDVPWQKFYMNEPLTNISTPEQQKLVIGGEVCMWGESIDASDIEQTIWPRAAAAAGNTGKN